MTTLPRPTVGPPRHVAPEHIHYPYREERMPTTGSGHAHWGVTAFTRWEGESMVDSVSVEVEAPSEGEAIDRAMELIQRPYYRVSWVKEACSKDTALKGE